jgi:hypothetical protein
MRIPGSGARRSASGTCRRRTPIGSTRAVLEVHHIVVVVVVLIVYAHLAEVVRRLETDHRAP